MIVYGDCGAWDARAWVGGGALLGEVWLSWHVEADMAAVLSYVQMCSRC